MDTGKRVCTLSNFLGGSMILTSDMPETRGLKVLDAKTGQVIGKVTSLCTQTWEAFQLTDNGIQPYPGKVKVEWN